MSSLSLLNKKTKTLKTYSLSIVTLGLNVVKLCPSLAASILKECEETDVEKVEQMCKHVAVDLMEDAKKVYEQIDRFFELDGNSIVTRREECPFIAEVWFGDTYGDMGIESLDALMTDLQETKRKLEDGDGFRQTCIEKVREEKSGGSFSSSSAASSSSSSVKSR